MDNFTEQLVMHKSGAKTYVIRTLIILAAISLCTVVVIGIMFFGVMMLLLVGLGAIYLAYYLLGNTITEYEYIVTNNDLDIDKILGKRKRRRLVSFKLDHTVDFGKYDGSQGNDAEVTVAADDGTFIDMYYMISEHSSHGKTMLVFSPDQRTIHMMAKKFPYQLRCRLPKELIAAPKEEGIGSEITEETEEAEVIGTAEAIEAIKAAETTEATDKPVDLSKD